MTAGRTYHVLGVPLRTGSLYPGSENDAQLRRALELLKGWDVFKQLVQKKAG